MRFLIDGDGVKRELPKEFQICGSRADINELIKQLSEAIVDDHWFYGWIEIRTPTERVSNTEPKKWTE